MNARRYTGKARHERRATPVRYPRRLGFGPLSSVAGWRRNCQRHPGIAPSRAWEIVRFWTTGKRPRRGPGKG